MKKITSMRYCHGLTVETGVGRFQHFYSNAINYGLVLVTELLLAVDVVKRYLLIYLVCLYINL